MEGKIYSSEGCADAMCADAERMAPPPPYPPQEDQPIRLGLRGSPWPICFAIVVVAMCLYFAIH